MKRISGVSRAAVKFALCALLFVLAMSCAAFAQEGTDFSYETKRFEYKADNGFVVCYDEISYPVFADSTGARGVINKKMEERVREIRAKGPLCFEEPLYGDFDAEAYYRGVSEDEPIEYFPYYYVDYVDVSYLGSDYIGLHHESRNYFGANRTYQMDYGEIFDAQSGQTVSCETVMGMDTESIMEKVRQAAKEKTREELIRQGNVFDESDIDFSGYSFDDVTYTLREEGMQFYVYTRYYTWGVTVTLPLSD